MNTFLVICFFVAWLALVWLASFTIRRTKVSNFEMQRRLEHGEPAALNAHRRETAIATLRSLRFIKQTLLTIVLVITAIFAWGAIGVLWALIMLLAVRWLSTVPFVHSYSQAWYRKLETWLLHNQQYWGWISFLNIQQPTHDQVLYSKQELQHLIAVSPGIVSENEQKSLVSMLEFADKKVKDVMRHRSEVTFAKSNEMLGPLTINELHQTGYSRFPVMDVDVDHIVGVLYIKDLFPLPTKNFGTVAKLMRNDVFYVRSDQPLTDALNAFVKTHHHLLVVIDKNRATLGIITIEDVLQALLGRKLGDEFDHYHDKQAVAERPLNSTAKQGVDI